jgi:ABC-type antimicrobial peptide transport system permease subunit
MLKNFLATSLRSIQRNWNYTLINTAGLSVGLATCILIFLVIDFELSFEKFHARFDSIYRVVRASTNASGTEHSSVTPYPFSQAFRNDFSDFPLMTQLHAHNEVQVTVGTEKYQVENAMFADSLFFDVFSFEVLSGNPHVDLGLPGKVFLTQSLAEKITPNGEKSIKLNNILNLEVAGILADIPGNSHIRFSMVVSWPSLSEEFLGLPVNQWGMNMSGYSYVVLPEHVSVESVTERFKGFAKKYHEENKPVYSLQPLSRVHTDDRYTDTAGGPGFVNTGSLMVLGLLGVFILVVACINFINLSTALAVKRSREIGVRKTLGASRKQLVVQYISEAFLLTLGSMAISLVAVQILLPILSELLQKNIQFSLTDGLLPAFLLGLLCITTLLSGLYPALVLSNFNPVAVLKNKLSAQGSSAAYARKYLVVFQFMIAQVLIIGTLVVADQKEYLRSKPLGFNREAILNISLPENTAENRSTLKNLLSAVPGVESISFSLGAPTSDNNFGTSLSLTGSPDTYETRIKIIDNAYLETYGIELAAGRWFTEAEAKAASEAVPGEQRTYVYVVNEAVVRQLGFAHNHEILGKKLTTGLNDITAEVIGVVKDFHTSSLHQQVEPVVLLHFHYFLFDAGIRLTESSLHNSMEAIEEAYQKVFPDYLFNYTFLDDHLAGLYEDEKRTFTLIRVVAGLAIFISCLGLLGLVSFLTQQKTKEVGIRKVFGASVPGIVLLYSKNFVVLIVVAFAISIPVAWYAMHGWLEEFAYHVALKPGAFVFSLAGTVGIALLTVLYQSVKAARVNPAHSLRNE